LWIDRERRLKVGLSTWCFLKGDVYAAVRAVGDAGFHHIELWGDVPHAYPERVDKRRLKDALSVYDISVTMHAPISDLNVASTFQPVKGAVQGTLRSFMSFSRSLDAHQVTFHPGSAQSETLVAESTKSAVETLRMLVREGGGSLKVNFENQSAASSPYYRPLASDLQSVDHLLTSVDGIGLTLDTGHANISGIAPDDFYTRFQKNITEVHLHDNHGTSDEHLPLGLGNAQLDGLAARLATDGVLVILELNSQRLQPSEVLALGEMYLR
jgi:sugar phosphate isomerase/epimerase